MLRLNGNSDPGQACSFAEMFSIFAKIVPGMTFGLAPKTARRFIAKVPVQHLIYCGRSNPGSKPILYSQLSWGLMRVLTKRDREAVSTLSLMFWLVPSTVLISTPVAAQTWQTIGTASLAIIFGVAMLGNLYNYLRLRALKMLPASCIINFIYILLPLSFLAGYIFFGNVLLRNAYVGCLVVVVLVFVSRSPRAEDCV